jgi:hypothetical protein
MAEIFDLDPTDANNVGRWPEGMQGGDINNAGRADEGMLARHYEDHDGSRTASGSSNAFAVSSSRTISSLFDNLTLVFTANHTITGAATLNLNGLGAKAVRRFNNNDLTAGDIISGTPVAVIYKSGLDVWIMVSAAAALFANMHADFNENGSPGNPSANVARLYAKDVSGLTRLAYRDSAGVEIQLANELIAIIEDQKSQNTSPQTLASGTDNVRELNTLAFNRNSLVSLSSNRFTLPAGTWEIDWWAPAHFSNNTGGHQTFLYNQTDAAEVARGTPMAYVNADGSDASSQISGGSAVVTITGSKAFEIRHRSSLSLAGGVVGNFGTEVYTRVKVRRAG